MLAMISKAVAGFCLSPAQWKNALWFSLPSLSMGSELIVLQEKTVQR